MNQTRICQLQYHNQNYSYICISLKCNQKIRLLCQTCLIQDLHNHDDGPKQNYLIELSNSRQLEMILRQKFHSIQCQTKERLSKYSQVMLKAFNYIKQHIEEAQKKYHNHELKSMRLLKNILNEKPFNINNILRLNNQELRELFSEDASKFQNYFMDEQFQIIQQTINMIDEKIKQNQVESDVNHQKDLQYIQNQIQIPQVQNNNNRFNNQNPNTFQINNDLNLQLNILIDSQYSQEIIHQSKKNFHHAEISPNEQYLVYGGKESILYIHDLQRKAIINKKLEQYISLCRFTKDSKYLYVGSNSGYVYGFSTDINFNQVWVINMYVISNLDIIVSSEDSYVAKFQVSNADKPLMIHCKDQGSIYCLEYNKQENLIIIAGEGMFIIAYDGSSGNSIIQLPQAHKRVISQMQLINQNKTLITLDIDGILKWWNVNYEKKLFQEIKNYYDSTNRIFGFYSVLNQQYIVYIGEKSINIIDNDNEGLVKVINFQANQLLKYRQIYQSNSLNYILVPCERQLILFRRL